MSALEPFISIAQHLALQRMRPSGQVVGLAQFFIPQLPALHERLHRAVVLQVRVQPVVHFTSHDEASLQAIALPSPRLNLQSACS